MIKVVNIENCFSKFSDTFSPKIVAELNDHQIKVVKVEGDKVPWHIHEKEDELFFVLEGSLEVHEKGNVATLNAGELCVVEHGTEHKIIPIGFVKLILIEPVGIAHTGKVRSEITRDAYDYIDT